MTGVVVVIAGMTLIISTNNKSKKEIGGLAIPTKVVVPTRIEEKYYSDTGAKFISPTDDQYTEIELIKILRNKLPMVNDFFSIDFDYKVNKFMVVIAGGSKTNLAIWQKWMTESGYDRISSQYFQIK